MKEKIRIAGTVILLGLLCSGCKEEKNIFEEAVQYAEEEESIQKEQSDNPVNGNEEESTIDTEEKVEAESDSAKEYRILMDNINYEADNNNFYRGKSWKIIEDSAGKKYYGLFDTNFQLLYKEEYKETYYPVLEFCTLPNKEGYTMITAGTDKVLNEEGSIVLSEGDTYNQISYDLGGVFVTSYNQHLEEYESAPVQNVLVKGDGTILKTFVQFPQEVREGNYYDVKDNYFDKNEYTKSEDRIGINGVLLHQEYAYNYVDDQLFEVNGTIIGINENGNFVCLKSERDGKKVVEQDNKGNIVREYFIPIEDEDYGMVYHYLGDGYVIRYHESDYAEGQDYIYDSNGNIVCDFTNVGQGIRIEDISQVDDGKVAIGLTSGYIGVVDIQGNVIIQPIKQEGENKAELEGISLSEGYLRVIQEDRTDFYDMDNRIAFSVSSTMVSGVSDGYVYDQWTGTFYDTEGNCYDTVTEEGVSDGTNT